MRQIFLNVFHDALTSRRQGIPPRRLRVMYHVEQHHVNIGVALPVNTNFKRLMAIFDTGGEVEDFILDRLLHDLSEGRGAGLFRHFSAKPTHQLNDIDGDSSRHMTQMGFAQTDIAQAA